MRTHRGELDGGIPFAYTPSLRSLRAFRLASAPLFIPSLPLGSDLVEGSAIIIKKDRSTSRPSLASPDPDRYHSFLPFHCPFLPQKLCDAPYTKVSARDPATIILCFNREFVIYGDVTFVWKIFYYRRCNDIKVLILRYYWIELSTIEREIRKESVSVSYNTECKILRVICNDSKH